MTYLPTKICRNYNDVEKFIVQPFMILSFYSLLFSLEDTECSLPNVTQVYNYCRVHGTKDSMKVVLQFILMLAKISGILNNVFFGSSEKIKNTPYIN